MTDEAKKEKMGAMMEKCMKAGRWFPIVPVIFGIIFLLLCTFLNAEIVKVLLMIFAGFIILLWVFGMIMMGAMKKKFTDGFYCPCC